MRLAELLTERPKWAWAILAAFAVFSAVMLPSLRIDTGVDPFFDEDSPHREVLDRVNAAFVSDDNLYIVYRSDNVFSTADLERIRVLGKRLGDFEQADGEPVFDDVMSLTTVKDVEGGELTFRNVPLVPTPVPDDPAGVARVRERAYENSVIGPNLVSEDGTATVVVARMADIPSPARADVIDRVRAAIANDDIAPEGVDTYLTGKTVVDIDEGAYTLADLQTFIPVAYAIIALILFLFLRRKLSVAMALGGGSLAIAFTVAVLPAAGAAMNSTSTMLPPVITALVAAMFIHYFSELGKHASAQSEPPRSLAKRTLGALIAPGGIAAITTSVGFASNAISDIPAIRGFGIAMGFGVIGAFVIASCVFALGARNRRADQLSAPTSVARSRRLVSLLEGLTSWHLKHRWLILAGSVAVIAFVIAGAGRIVVGMDQLAAFDEDTPIRRATAVMEENLGGSAEIVISIRHPARDHFLSPEVLGEVDRLGEFVRGEDVGADRVLSTVDFIKLMHRGFFGEQDSELRIPDTAEGVAQLLLINGDERLREYLDQSYAWTRVVARVPSTDSTAMAAKFDRVGEYLDEHFPAAAGYVAETTGNSKLYAEAMNDLNDTLIDSFSIAFIGIFLLLFLLFRSVSTGLYAIPVNLLPVAANLGLMGWLGIRLDPATVMISTVSIGIAVDDTVHFLQHLRARLTLHGDLSRGIAETIQFKGPAVIATSLVITLGFAVVLLSNFGPARNFGLLICSGVTAALLSDLILLPALLLCTRARLGISAVETASEPAQLPPEGDVEQCAI